MLGSVPRNPKVSRIWDSTHVTPRRFEFGSHGTRRGWTTQLPLDEPRVSDRCRICDFLDSLAYYVIIKSRPHCLKAAIALLSI